MGSLLKDTPHPQVNPHAPPALFPSHRQGSVLTHLLSPPTCRPWTLPTSGSHTMWPHVSKGPPLHSVSARRSPSLRSNTPLRGQTTLHLQLHQLPGTRAGLWALRAATNKAPGNTRIRLRPGRTVTTWLIMHDHVPDYTLIIPPRPLSFLSRYSGVKRDEVMTSQHLYHLCRHKRPRERKSPIQLAIPCKIFYPGNT